MALHRDTLTKSEPRLYGAFLLPSVRVFYLIVLTAHRIHGLGLFFLMPLYCIFSAPLISLLAIFSTKTVTFLHFWLRRFFPLCLFDELKHTAAVWQKVRIQTKPRKNRPQK